MRGVQGKMKMKRTNFYYPQPMLDAVKVVSNETGIPVSELIRTAIAEFLKKITVDRKSKG